MIIWLRCLDSTDIGKSLPHYLDNTVVYHKQPDLHGRTIIVPPKYLTSQCPPILQSLIMQGRKRNCHFILITSYDEKIPERLRLLTDWEIVDGAGYYSLPSTLKQLIQNNNYQEPSDRIGFAFSTISVKHIGGQPNDKREGEK